MDSIEQSLYALRVLMLKLQEQIIARDQADKRRRDELAKLLYGLDTTDPDAVLRALLAACTLLS